MSKQSSAYQYIGRLGNNVGYRPRGAKTNMLRSVSEGQSERVKTGAAYSNLRLYQKEFAAISAFSNLFFARLPFDRQTILKPHKVAHLNKLLVPLLAVSPNPFGSRSLEASNYKEVTLHYLERLRKGYIFDGTRYQFNASADWDPQQGTVVVKWDGGLSADDIARLHSSGIDGFDCYIYGYSFDAGTPGDASGGFTTPSYDLYNIVNVSLNKFDMSGFGFEFPIPDGKWFDCYIFIYAPWRGDDGDASRRVHLVGGMTFDLLRVF